MQAQRVKITLTGLSQLTATDLWAQIWAGLALQFPLRNLHWKPATRTSIRTIQSLDVSLLSLETTKEEGASQIPASILDKPLLNIFVVACEDNEVYRSTVKKQIKDWHSQVAQRKAQEWVIFNVSKSDPRPTQTGLLKMRGTVIDRIRADFNVDKKDRCAQLTWISDLKSPAIWAEVITRVKDGIITAFDSAVSQREEEVKRSESQKTMPGWNFCTFFLLKESLATSFEGANLLEDALLQYEELEASFFQVLKDKTLWFGNYVEPSPKDDSLPLLSTTKKPYRDLILANAISVFDIRVYLLARQAIVLGHMGRLTDVTKKVSVFLGALGARLEDFKACLSEYFIESWIYSSALSAVDTCDEWARGREIDSNLLNSFNAGKGELLTASRTQLDRLGVRLGYLPNEPPFSNSLSRVESLDSTTHKNKRSSRQISNPDIVSFLDNKAAFYDTYIRLTNKAIDLFVKAGRRKFALKLHGSLAALDLHRQRFATAHQIFTSLPAHYAPHHWSNLEAYMLFQSIGAHEKMNHEHDRQWIHAAVDFIKAYMEDGSVELLDGLMDINTFLRQLVAEILKASSRVDEVVFQDHPLFEIVPLCESIRCAGNQDGFLLDVMLLNHLPCDLPMDHILISLSGRGNETMDFIARMTLSESGHHSVTFFCPNPASGIFLLSRGEVRLGHLVFQWLFGPKQKRRQSTLVTDPKAFSKLVRLPTDPRAVYVDIQQTRKVEIAGPSWLTVALHCGRNTLTKATVKLSSPDVTINTKEGSLRSGSNASFLEDGVSFIDAPAEQVIRFYLPHSRADGKDMIKVRADLEYETLHEPGVTRKRSMEQMVQIVLDLAVNVQDYFLGERLLTKFTISTTSHQHVRISSVDLRPSDGDRKKVKITKNKAQRLLTITPAQPASFVFQLEACDGAGDPLRLCMTYRLLREEVEAVVARSVQTLLPKPDHWEQSRIVHDAIVHELERNSSWIEMYEVTGEIHLPGGELKVPGVENDILKRITQGLRAPIDNLASDEEWREFSIPVDLPRLDILASARVDLVASPFDRTPLKRHHTPVYAGQPIMAIVSIHTSFYWAGPDKDVDEYRMRFHLEENIKDWLISGQKRGDFKARHGSTHTIILTLMALRHGELSLPKVHVSAYPLAGNESNTPPSLETDQVNGAERLLVLPRGGRTTFFLNVDKEQ